MARVFEMDYLVERIGKQIDKTILGESMSEKLTNKIMQEIEAHLVSALKACPECFTYGLRPCHIECSIQGHVFG